MEAEVTREKVRVKKGVIIADAVFLVFVLYYTVMALLSPARKISSINEEFGFKNPENSTVDERIFSDSAFVSMNRNKSFLQARIAIAESDSISLSLNLADSTAILELTGVTLNKAKISHIKLSHIFFKADEYAISAMLATPFTISKDYTSIRKEPLMLKVAPKDTSEYKPDILPDTSKAEAVNYMLEMGNGFRLYVYQETTNGTGGGLGRFMFDLGDRFRNSWNIIKSIALFRVPEYHPFIKIRLSREDARNIYRGLPRKGQVAVYR
jgi:hypothetical protein